MPVVLLSHGGASGKTNPLASMEHWAPVVARSGYLAVAIAHPGREQADYDALCAALEVQPEIRCGIKLSWDRPHDVAAVLDWLEAQATRAPLAGQVDLTRVAHMGHSAGAGAALMSVGATRNFVCAQPFGEVSPEQDCQESDLVSLADPRIDVAVALSPQGPGTEGFMHTSYGAVTRPVLIATGANDGDPGEPETRLGIFPLLPAGDKYELYLDAQGAKHTLFEGNIDACTPLASAAECTAMRGAVYTTAIAFLDAHLAGSAAAAAWLASDDIVNAGQGIIRFQRRPRATP